VSDDGVVSSDPIAAAEPECTGLSGIAGELPIAVSAVAEASDPESEPVVTAAASVAPAAQAPAPIPAGWYPDILLVHDERYWDGQQWTAQVRNEKRAAAEPPLISSSVGAAASNAAADDDIDDDIDDDFDDELDGNANDGGVGP
jgi:hypothetical protein